MRIGCFCRGGELGVLGSITKTMMIGATKKSGHWCRGTQYSVPINACLLDTRWDKAAVEFVSHECLRRSFGSSLKFEWWIGTSFLWLWLIVSRPAKPTWWPDMRSNPRRIKEINARPFQNTLIVSAWRLCSRLMFLVASRVSLSKCRECYGGGYIWIEKEDELVDSSCAVEGKKAKC